MKRIAVLMLIACGSPKTEKRAPVPTPTPTPVEPSADASDQRPRCIQAGGYCAGMATVNANPGAPCRANYHRVDDVGIAGTSPACLGIPLGEEACCMPN